MKTIMILLVCSAPAFAQWQRSERIIEVPQPPVRVRQYVPQDVDVPQPPLRYKEVTESRMYVVPLDEPQVTYQADPVVRYAMPVAYAKASVAYAVPVVYVVPRRIRPTPVRDFLFGR